MPETLSDLRYITYCRKSSESEDKQVLSIESQKRELAQIISAQLINNLETLAETKSAYKTGREEFNQMLELFEKGKADAILTWHLTRLARNSFDGGRLIYMMDSGLIKEIRTPERNYRNTTDDKFLMQIHFAMAKKSSDDTSDFVKRDIQTKLLKGEFPGCAPYGYLNIDREGRIAGKSFSMDKQVALVKDGRPLRRIEPDPFIAPLIVKLFEACASGLYSLSSLSQMGYEWGLKGDRAKKQLGKSSLLGILTNPFYYGGLRWKGQVFAPEEMPEDSRHVPIIDEELFCDAQKALKANTRQHGKNAFYSYSNLIHCAKCGGQMSGLVVKGHLYYRCARCRRQKYIKEEELETQIVEKIQAISIDDELYQLALQEIQKEVEQENSVQETKISLQKRELVRCQSRLDNLLTLKISPENLDNRLLSDEEFLSQKTAILAEMKILKAKIENSEKHSWQKPCLEFFGFCHRLAGTFRKSSPLDKREIFMEIFESATYADGILELKAKQLYEILTEIEGKRGSIITGNYGLNKTKKTPLASLRSVWLSELDSNQ